VPILLVLGAASAVAEFKPEYGPAKRFMGCVIPLAGLAIFVSSLTEAVKQFHLDQAGSAFRSIVVPPILSIAAVPVAYLFSLIATTELLLVRLRFALRNDESGVLARYARWAILRRCRFSPRKIDQFGRVYMRNLHGISSRREVDSVIELSRRMRRGVNAIE
jgi:hypothetical protein